MCAFILHRLVGSAAPHDNALSLGEFMDVVLEPDQTTWVLGRVPPSDIEI